MVTRDDLSCWTYTISTTPGKARRDANAWRHQSEVPRHDRALPTHSWRASNSAIYSSPVQHGARGRPVSLEMQDVELYLMGVYLREVHWGSYGSIAPQRRGLVVVGGGWGGGWGKKSVITKPGSIPGRRREAEDWIDELAKLPAARCAPARRFGGPPPVGPFVARSGTQAAGRPPPATQPG